MTNILHQSAPVCAQNNGSFSPLNRSVLGVPLGILANISSAHGWRGLQDSDGMGEPPLGGSPTAPSGAVKFDPETGEILEEDKPFDPGLAKIERFRLQSVSRKLLPHFRVSSCCRSVFSKADGVEVLKSVTHGGASYGGLQTCGSSTACPVCASRISEVRGVQLKAATEAWNKQGGDVLMLTLTIPHKDSDYLPTVLTAQAKAMSRFNGGRASHALFDQIGCIGSVRSFEIMHGSNGWHPHFHILLFVKTGLDLDSLEFEFYKLWANSCRLAKLPIPSREHGCDLRDGTKAHDYVTKFGNWGIVSEMTKSNLKISKKSKSSRSPFDLLNDYSKGDHVAGFLFRECMEALKGKNMLVWSKGLKGMFDIDDKTDQEIVDTHDDDAIVLGRITYDEWRLIVKHNLRGEILVLAKHGWSAIDRLIQGLVEGCTDEQERTRHIGKRLKDRG